MSALLPPELISPEERAERVARAAELQQEVSQQWLRFAIVEATVIWVPFGVFVVLYVTGVLSDSYLVPGIVVASVATVALMGYWTTRADPAAVEGARAARGGLDRRPAIRRRTMRRRPASRTTSNPASRNIGR